jgi:hypothetical protein
MTMNTLEAFQWLENEADKASVVEAGLRAIGRDPSEFAERTAKLRECGRKLVAFNELLSEARIVNLLDRADRVLRH